MTQFQFAIVCLCSSLHLLLPAAANGQKAQERDSSEAKPIIVINADKTTGYQMGRRNILESNVILRQDSTVIHADRVEMVSDSNLARASGEVVIQRDDTTNAFCQLLDYYGNRYYAYMSDDVILQSGRQKLFTDLLEYNLKSNVALYRKRALMTDGENLISSKKGRYFIDSALVVFVDSVVVAGPEFSMKTDSLHFHVEKRRTEFVAPVRIHMDERRLYCEDGHYDLASGDAMFIQNAQYSSGSEEAGADTIIYMGNTGDVTLIGHAWSRDEDREVRADTIQYFQSEDVAIFIGNVDYSDENQTATGDYIKYDLNKETFETKGRTEMRQDGQYLAADETRDLPGRDEVLASGHVVWHDTAQGISLYSEEAILNRKSEETKAFGDHMQLITEMDGDSLFLTADTFLSEKKMDEDSITYRHFRGWNRVVGYKSDMQLVADSMSYSERDSAFRLFGHPVIWSDTNRFHADTILLTMSQNRIDRMYLIGHAFITNKKNEEFYNQIKGRHIVGDFRENRLTHAHITGNAESVYYAVDEGGGYIGVNKIASSEIKMDMVDGQIDKVRFIGASESKFHPVTNVDHKSLRLEGFDFDDELRPLFSGDIFRIYDNLLQ